MGRISPHEQFFSTDAVCHVCDKYQVWYCCTNHHDAISISWPLCDDHPNHHVELTSFHCLFPNFRNFWKQGRLCAQCALEQYWTERSGRTLCPSPSVLGFIQAPNHNTLISQAGLVLSFACTGQPVSCGEKRTKRRNSAKAQHQLSPHLQPRFNPHNIYDLSSKKYELIQQHRLNNPKSRDKLIFCAKRCSKYFSIAELPFNIFRSNCCVFRLLYEKYTPLMPYFAWFTM